jgi:8-oxo-dGTP diphosphatase
MPFTYEFPRPALTVDAVVFGFDGNRLQVLLIRRGIAPFCGMWALPGGFVRDDETLEAAVRRELEEETGVRAVYLEQFHAFSAPDRDPRERVVSVAFWALVRMSDHRTAAATDASDAQWFPVPDLPGLAFDHADIAAAAITHLRERIRRQPFGFNLLPEKFTLTELQTLYEAIAGESLDKRNFRKRILALGFLTALAETRSGGAHRPAQLFRFNLTQYQRLVRRGFHFDL